MRAALLGVGGQPHQHEQEIVVETPLPPPGKAEVPKDARPDGRGRGAVHQVIQADA